MQPSRPKHSPTEAARLQALQSYGILDTPAQEGFDQLAQLAAQLCQCPMAVVNFIDAERQWFKASVGIGFKETDRAIALCAHALSGSREPVVVPDARLHPTFAGNPLVRDDPHIRLYACVPLVTDEGLALGTLAVFDRMARTLQPEQITGLQILAAQVMSRLDLRYQKQALQALAHELVHERDQMHCALVALQSAQHQAQEKLRVGEERFQLVARATADAVWDWDLCTGAMWWNEGMQSLFGIPLVGLPADSTSWSLRLHPEDSQEVLHSITSAITGTASHWSAQYRFRRYDDSYAWVSDRGFLIRDPQGTAVRMVGSMTDISAQKRAQSEAEQDAQNHADLVQLQQRISCTDTPLADVLHMVVTTVLHQTHARGALIELLQEGCIVVQASVGDHIRPKGHRMLQSKGLLWPTLSQGRTVVCDDTLAQGWDMNALEHRQGVRSMVAAPLRSGEMIIGAIKVTSDQANAFAPRDVAHLEILAESVGAMVQLRRVAGQLHASEQQYRRLFDMHPHPMWVYDVETLQLRAVNQAMKAHYGYTEAQLLAMHLPDLWMPEHRERTLERLRNTALGTVQDACKETDPSAAISRHVTQSGALRDMQITAVSTQFDNRPARQVLAIDVTDRLRTDADIARMSRAYRLLSACNETLVRATSEITLLHAVCEIAVDIGGYRLGWVGFALDDERKSITPVAHAGYNPDYLEHLNLSWSADSPQGRGPAGVAVRTGKPVIVQDIRAEGLFASGTEHMLAHKFHGVICLPLRDRDRDHVFGLLYLYAPEVLQTSAQETQLLQELSNDLAFGITSLRAQQAQQRMQASVLKVAAAVSASTDTDTEFFAQLASNMVDAVGGQGGCVLRVLPGAQGEAARTVSVAAVLDGNLLARDEYALDSTPSHRLLTQPQYVVTDKVQQQYPKAPMLRHVDAQAYVGQQLCDANGAVVGIVFVLFRQAIYEVDFITSTLQIFASRAAAEIQRQHADERIRHQASLLDQAQDAIFVRDMDNRIIFWNKGAERVYGWTQQEALGQTVSALLRNNSEAFDTAYQAVRAHGEWTGEITKYHRDGRPIDIESRWTLVRPDGGNLHRGDSHSILSIDTDISQRKANEREIQRLAFYDALTGLPNRMLLTDRMEQALANARSRQQGGALLFIDLDNFKTLNDTLGHDKGDLLLQQVAQRLTTCVRSMDTVARLGGDEFVVMIEEINAQPEALALYARNVGEKILTVLAAPYALAGYQYRSTPSIGIAPFTGTHASVGELLKQADLAMYQAKTAGRHTLRFFDPQIQVLVAERAALETDLRTALALEEFLLHFQPQMHADGYCVGVEALLRWPQPQRGMVSPARFIPLAEETGLILPLGRWVLHTACKLLASWQTDPLLAGMTMAVNVSLRQFRHPGFVDDVAHLLAITGAPARQLKLELTESVLAEDMEATIATMMALRTHGVGFSLDDFGTGYSSLSYLKRMPLDQIKIDQSFVRDISTDPNDEVIVGAIIGLSRSLGLEVIAEGVETLEQRAMLAKAGCQLYQGYFFSRPLPVQVLEPFLRTLGR